MKMIKSLLVSLFVVAVMLCGCGTEETIDGEEFLPVIQKAIESLESVETSYIIATTIEAPNDSTQYIECVKGDVSYTEYSVDADGNFGTLEYGSQESIPYVLNDWLDSDGKYYLFTTDEFGEDTIYSIEGYKDAIDGRAVLYASDMLEGAMSIEQLNDLTINLGFGEETFSLYKVKVKSETIKRILGAPSLGVYEALKTQEASGSNVSELLEYYIEDLEMSLTFSDANVIFGIDKTGCLRYTVVEVGGLGSHMYVTKAVVELDNQNLRETPDFTGAVPFRDTLLELADFVASFESYDDALDALYSE